MSNKAGGHQATQQIPLATRSRRWRRLQPRTPDKRSCIAAGCPRHAEKQQAGDRARRRRREARGLHATPPHARRRRSSGQPDASIQRDGAQVCTPPRQQPAPSCPSRSPGGSAPCRSRLSAPRPRRHAIRCIGERGTRWATAQRALPHRYPRRG